MTRNLLTLLLLLLSTTQLQALAVTQVINDEDKYKPIQLKDSVRSITVNTTGAQLDLTHFKESIIVNGNANQIVAGPCESLVIVGSGNSIDLVDGSHVTKIRQGHDLYQKPSTLKFYELDAKNESGIKIIEPPNPVPMRDKP